MVDVRFPGAFPAGHPWLRAQPPEIRDFLWELWLRTGGTRDRLTDLEDLTSHVGGLAAALAAAQDAIERLRNEGVGLTVPDLAAPRDEAPVSVASGNGGDSAPVSLLPALGRRVGALEASEAPVMPLSPDELGDVRGPDTSTDNALVRWDGPDGKLLQDSGVLLDDSGNLTGVASLGLSAGDIEFGATGSVHLPNQPVFAAYLGTTATDVTGTATNYTVVGYTETVDQGGVFNPTTGVFTAPVDGIYCLSARVLLSGITAAGTLAIARILTSEGTYLAQKTEPGAGTISLTLTALVPLSATDTASVVVRADGEAADVVDVIGSAARYTTFHGWLVA